MIREQDHPTHWFRTGVTAALALAAVVAVRSRRVVVDGRSMLPAFEPGDRLLVIPLRSVRVGSVVAMRDPRDHSRILIKRVRARIGPQVDVRGDNAAESTDSRHFGLVPRSALAGRVIFRYSPASRAGWWPQ
jgi:nickel-type superoxide dismutase maturation protease